MMTYFQYILVDNFTNSLDSATYSSKIAPSYVSVRRYTPGISHVATSQPSCASTAVFINTGYVSTIGEAAASFFIVSWCFLTSAHERSFMYPPRFSFRNIGDATASVLYFLVSFVASTGAKVSRECSFVSYSVTDNSPRSLELLRPVFSAYCVMMMWIMQLSFLVSVILGAVPYVFRWTCPLSQVYPLGWGLSW